MVLKRAVSLLLLLSPPIIGASAIASTHQAVEPDIASARENGVLIFNAVHSAMRQWGSSLNHNGLSLIPATVPKGTLLYHGTIANKTPDSYEWLAFEIEHAENFAGSRPRPPGDGHGPPGGPRRPGPPPPFDNGPHADGRDRIQMFPGQIPLGATTDDPDETPNIRGYLHTYHASRDLKLLYIDGMSAGKTNKGTLDTQDLLLRGLTNDTSFNERARADDICRIMKSWGLDGVIRMEAGFEILYCDFRQGLELVEMLRRPRALTFEAGHRMDSFEWLRAAAERYDGIGGGRVQLDFSRMVSALWYPIDVTNSEGGLPRLNGTTPSERKDILGRVEEAVRSWDGPSLDWQGVVDMVVARHEGRIAYLAEADVEEQDFVEQVLGLTNTFVDYPPSEFDIVNVEILDEVEQRARARCTEHYLRPARESRSTWSKEDEMIDAAIEAVTGRICSDFFTVKGLLAKGNDDRESTSLAEAVRKGREIVRTLKKDLDWTAWKKCSACKVNEICFVAIWPFGLIEDHYTPSCMNRTTLAGRAGFRMPGESYWSD